MNHINEQSFQSMCSKCQCTHDLRWSHTILVKVKPSLHQAFSQVVDVMFHTYTCIAVQHSKLECGPMPNVMVALLNIGGALCSTSQSLADAHYWSADVPCSNAAKTRNPLKFAGVPQTGKPISTVSGPKFAIL